MKMGFAALYPSYKICGFNCRSRAARNDTNQIQAFKTDIQSVPEVRALLDLVAEDAELRELTGGTRLGDPLTASLSLVAVAALWKLLSLGITELRRMGEDATAERRIQLIGQLRQMGYDTVSMRTASLALSRLAGQDRVTVTLKRADGKTIHIRKATRAEPRQQVIYDALGISDRPGRTEKTIV